MNATTNNRNVESPHTKQTKEERHWYQTNKSMFETNRTNTSRLSVMSGTVVHVCVCLHVRPIYSSVVGCNQGVCIKMVTWVKQETVSQAH